MVGLGLGLGLANLLGDPLILSSWLIIIYLKFPLPDQNMSSCLLA